MEKVRRQPIAGAVAGLLLGFLVGVFVAPDPSSVEYSARPVWTYAIIGAVLGVITIALVALVANRRVPTSLLVPVIVFASITVIPWFPSQSGDLLPVGTAYVNRGFPWQLTLIIHVALTALATVVVIVAISVRRYFKHARPTRHSNF